jgi:hypothetical protein
MLAADLSACRLGCSRGILFIYIYMGQFVAQSLTAHPTLWLDWQQPVLNCGNASKIFPEMLFSHISDGDLLSITAHDGYAEQLDRPSVYLVQKQHSALLHQ